MMYLVHGKVEQRCAGEQQGQNAHALLRSALVYYEKAMHHLTRTQAHTTLSQLYGHMAEVYETLGRSEEALTYWKSAFSARAPS
jgi:tetratricopeptide (TPR) repeat protein